MVLLTMVPRNRDRTIHIMMKQAMTKAVDVNSAHYGFSVFPSTYFVAKGGAPPTTGHI